MLKREHLTVPIIGVAKAGWNLEQLRARARDSLEQHGGGVEEAAFAKLSSLLKAHIPLYQYEPGTWGPAEVERVTPPGGWVDPGVASA